VAAVALGDQDPPCQIVFGGDRKLTGGELVPVAPPGSRAIVRTTHIGELRTKKMRARRFRGERSHGMLCSLDELGWIQGGPDEVAILRDLAPGESLDDLPNDLRPNVVEGWTRAMLWEQARLAEKIARTELTDTFDPIAEAVRT